MPEQRPYGDRPEHRYDETVKPSNPPNSVLRPAVRRTAVWTYVGILAVTFIVAGAAFLVWAPLDDSRLPDGQEVAEPGTMGTSGERTAGEGSPGGFDPIPQHDSTEDELEFRGAGSSSEATTGSRAATLRGLGALQEGSETAGRRIELENVEVVGADGGTFRVRDGSSTTTVIAPGGMPTVREGQRVNVSGTVEQNGNELRIRASRIDVK